MKYVPCVDIRIRFAQRAQIDIFDRKIITVFKNIFCVAFRGGIIETDIARNIARPLQILGARRRRNSVTDKIDDKFFRLLRRYVDRDRTGHARGFAQRHGKLAVARKDSTGQVILFRLILCQPVGTLHRQIGLYLIGRRGTGVKRFAFQPFFVDRDSQPLRRLRARDGSLREKRKHDARHRQKRQQRCENDPLCLTHNFLLLPRFPGAAIPNFLSAANVSADLSHIFSSAARRKSVFLTHAYPHSARHPQTRRA